MIRTLVLASVAILAFATAGLAPVAAQNYPAFPDPYNPYATAPSQPLTPGLPWSLVSSSRDPAGVINAVGNLPIQQAQARLLGESANQAAIQTRQMAFDEGRYEAAHTPTFLAQQDRWTQINVLRALNPANGAAVVHGDSLNQLLPYLTALAEQNPAGPTVPISAATLHSINFQAGQDGPTAGMLKDKGQLTWPLQLKGSEQQALDALLPRAIQDAAANRLELSTYNEMVSLVDTVKEETYTRYMRDEITGDAYRDASEFLCDLESSLAVLQRPDAARIVDGTSAVQGNTVPELVENMTRQGLQFAPATTGSEATYFALHGAFVTYARQAEAAALQASLNAR
jgi:hypothetical protein